MRASLISRALIEFFDRIVNQYYMPNYIFLFILLSLKLMPFAGFCCLQHQQRKEHNLNSTWYFITKITPSIHKMYRVCLYCRCSCIKWQSGMYILHTSNIFIHFSEWVKCIYLRILRSTREKKDFSFKSNDLCAWECCVTKNGKDIELNTFCQVCVWVRALLCFSLNSVGSLVVCKYTYTVYTFALFMPVMCLYVIVRAYFLSSLFINGPLHIINWM